MVIDVGHQELAKVFDDRPSNAIVSDPLDDGFRFDVAQLLQGHFLLQSVRKQEPSARETEKKKTHIFDPFHIVHIPTLVVLSTSSGPRSGEQSGLIVILSANIVAIEEGWRMAPICGAHATAATTLHAIALSHLRLCHAPRRGGHRLEDFLVVQADVGVRVK
jgi:hypothetical protein